MGSPITTFIQRVSLFFDQQIVLSFVLRTNKHCFCDDKHFSKYTNMEKSQCEQCSEERADSNNGPKNMKHRKTTFEDTYKDLIVIKNNQFRYNVLIVILTIIKIVNC